ncbi:MAG: asparagine synthase (glutamine-hydrolyzing) [Saprospiraceae bacterium]
MCGIYGYLGEHQKINRSEIDALLQHRGPDDSGEFEYNNVLFMFWRLAIQDLSPLGHQPMISDDENFAIIFNGEIYNHQEIRNKLLNKYSFKSRSDTETILYGFQEYGVELFNMLNGIFAMAILDKAKNEIIVVRDQIGVKPLYYYSDEKSFVFSSELKAVLNSSISSSSLDPEGLVNYLFYLWSPGEKTAIQQIHKLKAGHYIRIDLHNISNIENQKYYELPFDDKKEIKEYKFWEAELEEKLMTAIERQLLADVPIGFFLSGGLDSSLLIAMYRKLYPDKEIKAFTIATGKEFEAEGFSDDLYFAKMVAEHLNVELVICESKIDMIEKFDHMIWHLDEPQADLAPLHIENICIKAREENYFVLLSGAGGDDLFSGYRRHQSIGHSKRLKYFPFASKLLILLAKFSNKVNKRRIQKYLGSLDSKDPMLAMVNTYSWCDLDQIRSFFSDEYKQRIADYDPRKELVESLHNIPNEQSVLNKMLYWDIKYFLTDHNLNYTDKLSMSQGVEVRVPYLDKELVEFSTRLPDMYKMNGTTTKFILRKLAEKYLPHEVIYRPKTGFGAPIRNWIKHDLSDWVKLRLSKENIEKQGIFNSSEIEKYIENNNKGAIDGSYTILSLLAIESFYRQFVTGIKK